MQDGEPNITEKCDFCGEPLRIYYPVRDISKVFRDYSANCPKCCAHYMTPLSEPKTSCPRDSEQHVCFLCHKAIVENKKLATYPIEPKTWREGWYYAHLKCDEAVAKPFFRKLYKLYLKDDYTEADEKAFATLESAFVKLVLMLNVGESIRKIADQLKIDRGKVWRIAKHIAELKA